MLMNKDVKIVIACVLDLTPFQDVNHPLCVCVLGEGKPMCAAAEVRQ